MSVWFHIVFQVWTCYPESAVTVSSGLPVPVFAYHSRRRSDPAEESVYPVQHSELLSWFSNQSEKWFFHCCMCCRLLLLFHRISRNPVAMHLPFAFVSERPEPESALFRRMPVAVPGSAAFPHWIVPAWQLFFAAAMLLLPDLIEPDAALILSFRKLTVLLRKQAGYNRQKSLCIPAGTARQHSFFAHLTDGFRPEVAASRLPAGFFHHPVLLSHL